MHGLKTINQLNELAALNGNAEETLAKAEAFHAGRDSSLETAYREQVKLRQAARQKAIDTLLALSNDDLISLAEGVKGYPSTLETALAHRLKQVCRTFGLSQEPK